MEQSKVYFSDLRAPVGTNLLRKLEKLIRRAGIGDIDMEKKLVAIKLHFGEPGNLTYLRPNYAKVVADVVKSLGGVPFLTDCNTLYPGRRKNALEHMEAAYENGFSPFSTGCHVIIGDGLRGTDDVEVPVEGAEYIQTAKIGRAIMDADVFISLTHFKGHEATGFGGAIKNIGMGCGSRRGKMEQHNAGKPLVRQSRCVGCRRCSRECGQDAISYGEDGKAGIDQEKCVGCGRCIARVILTPSAPPTTRPMPSSTVKWRSTPRLWCRTGRSSTSVWSSISPHTATATTETIRPSCPMWACLPLSTRWRWTRPVPTPASSFPSCPAVCWTTGCMRRGS